MDNIDSSYFSPAREKFGTVAQITRHIDRPIGLLKIS